MKVGRNDPCPCGSGKKFKKCWRAHEAETLNISPAFSPAEMVLARCRAFEKGDFGFIYDTYHPESYFRTQFPSRRAYLRYGASSLSDDFGIRECRILKEDVADDDARVLFYLDTLFQGNPAETFELSFFRRTEGGWLYHSSQKLAREDFAGEIEEIGFRDFERVKDKVFF